MPDEIPRNLISLGFRQIQHSSAVAVNLEEINQSGQSDLIISLDVALHCKYMATTQSVAFLYLSKLGRDDS